MTLGNQVITHHWVTDIPTYSLLHNLYQDKTINKDTQSWKYWSRSKHWMGIITKTRHAQVGNLIIAWLLSTSYSNASMNYLRRTLFEKMAADYQCNGYILVTHVCWGACTFYYPRVSFEWEHFSILSTNGVWSRCSFALTIP